METARNLPSRKTVTASDIDRLKNKPAIECPDCGGPARFVSKSGKSRAHFRAQHIGDCSNSSTRTVTEVAKRLHTTGRYPMRPLQTNGSRSKSNDADKVKGNRKISASRSIVREIYDIIHAPDLNLEELMGVTYIGIPGDQYLRHPTNFSSDDKGAEVIVIGTVKQKPQVTEYRKTYLNLGNGKSSISLHLQWEEPGSSIEQGMAVVARGIVAVGGVGTILRVSSRHHLCIRPITSHHKAMIQLLRESIGT